MELTPILDGLSFGEGPRWHGDRLWFSDFYRHRVSTVTIDGETEVMLEVPQQPSGLGWLPDGDLLVVSMLDRRLLRWDGQTTSVHADLSALVSSPCNDMVVDEVGRAYVGNFGFNRHQGEPFAETTLVIVEPDGALSVGADALAFPNGTVITPDGATLIIGESMGNRLTAFDRNTETGALDNRRVWADLGDNLPDGICLDARGRSGSPIPGTVRCCGSQTVAQVTDRIHCDEGRHAFACMLGGPDRRTLFVVTNFTSGPKAESTRNGRIETVEVAVPGAGLP